MKKQSQHNEHWSKRQIEKGLCRFCNNKHLPNQKTCAIHYLKVLAKNGLNDREHGEALYLKLIEQNYKCYLTGRELILGINASLDHIVAKSNNKELSNDINNVKWVDSKINRMKTNLDLNDFIEICKEVVFHNS